MSGPTSCCGGVQYRRKISSTDGRNFIKAIEAAYRHFREGKFVMYRMRLDEEKRWEPEMMVADTPGQAVEKLLSVPDARQTLVDADKIEYDENAYSRSVNQYNVTPWQVVVPEDKEGFEVAVLELSLGNGYLSEFTSEDDELWPEE